MGLSEMEGTWVGAENRHFPRPIKPAFSGEARPKSIAGRYRPLDPVQGTIGCFITATRADPGNPRGA